MGIYPKNRVYCNGSRRRKILFETEEKANNFLKFNADEICEQSGVKPIRVYYCPACGGWHVTHVANEQQYQYNFTPMEKIQKKNKPATEELKKKNVNEQALALKTSEMLKTKIRELEVSAFNSKRRDEDLTSALLNLAEDLYVFSVQVTGYKVFIRKMSKRINNLLNRCAA